MQNNSFCLQIIPEPMFFYPADTLTVRQADNSCLLDFSLGERENCVLDVVLVRKYRIGLLELLLYTSALMLFSYLTKLCKL